jgi:hypothetical protein
VKTVDIICRCEAGDTSKRRPPPDSNAALRKRRTVHTLSFEHGE